MQRKYLIAFLLAINLHYGPSLHAQAESLLSRGVELPTPRVAGIEGQRDAAALVSLDALVAKTSKELSKSYVLSGSLVRATEQASAALPAKLHASSNHLFRFDTTERTGERSLRGQRGHLQGKQEGGEVLTLPTAQFSEPFPLPFQVHEYAMDPTTSILDRGLFSIGEVQLHRITLLSYPDKAVSTSLVRTQVTDVYVNDKTKQLIYLVRELQELGGSGRPSRQVTVYGDYRPDSYADVPFKMVLLVNGRPALTYTIDSVRAEPTSSAASFHF